MTNEARYVIAEIKELIQDVKLKANYCEITNKVSRARRGVYVDCAQMIEEKIDAITFILESQSTHNP